MAIPMAYVLPSVYDDDFSPLQWARHLTRVLGREFIFLEFPFPRGIYGARLIVTAPSATEYVFVASSIHPLLQGHVRLHELAHAACGHPTLTLAGLDDDAIACAMREPAVLCQRAMQPGIQTHLELEAEELTRFIQQQTIGAQHARAAARISARAPIRMTVQHLGIE